MVSCLPREAHLHLLKIGFSDLETPVQRPTQHSHGRLTKLQRRAVTQKGAFPCLPRRRNPYDVQSFPEKESVFFELPDRHLPECHWERWQGIASLFCSGGRWSATVGVGKGGLLVGGGLFKHADRFLEIYSGILRDSLECSQSVEKQCNIFLFQADLLSCTVVVVVLEWRQHLYIGNGFRQQASGTIFCSVPAYPT